MSEPTLLYLSLPDTVVVGQADHQLTSALAGSPDPRIVDVTHLAYQVEPYYIAYGLPVADSVGGVDCSVQVQVGDLSALAVYPRPYTVDLGAAARWLPLEGTFDDGQLWAPFQGAESVRLDADGTSPTRNDAFEYLLGTQFAAGPAMVNSGGDYFMTDQLRWGATSVMVALVAVLRTPVLDSYGLLETYPADSADPNRSFVGLRYLRDGVVATHIQGLQAIRQTSSGAVRTGQPVLVALMVTPPATVDVAIVDRSLTHWTSSLVSPHPYDARMYVGLSPSVEQGSAEMDILEVGYWTDLDMAGMLGVVNQLDALYGVSR